MEVQTGDEVLFAKYGGTDVTVDGSDYLIMRESDILAVLTKTAVPA
jgi:chaperonin GroES